MPYRAEYIWIDGSEPTQLLRSKTRVLPDGAELPIWGFDGSSTNQAPGSESDCVLRPVRSIPDPIRGGDNVLVLCEVLNTRPDAACVKHPSRPATRPSSGTAVTSPGSASSRSTRSSKMAGPSAGPQGGFPAPQGGYYCGIGADEIFGRDVVEEHTTACIESGLEISGTNAEVMMGQWEFQIGPLGPVEASDEIWLARWLLYRIGEDLGRRPRSIPSPSRATGTEPARTPTSPPRRCGRATTRSSPPPRPSARLTTSTSRTTEPGSSSASPACTRRHPGPSTATASPTGERRSGSPGRSKVDGKGYLEDRRPNANMDPYVVTRLITETVCKDADG